MSAGHVSKVPRLTYQVVFELGGVNEVAIVSEANTVWAIDVEWLGL
jgi:hypothetical protein